MDEGKLESIWIKRVRRGPMDTRSEARLVAGQGLEDNANQGGKRQVTLLSRESWDAVERELGQAIDPSTRRANLLLSGIDLKASRGQILRLGPCRVQIYGETRPCRLMDELCPGLQAALDPHWRAGAFGQVLVGGPLRIGDPVAWEADA